MPFHVYQPKDNTQFPPKSLWAFLNSDQSHSVHMCTMEQRWSHIKPINVVYNFVKKYLLLRVSHHPARILHDVQEWACPTVFFMHLWNANSLRAFGTRWREPHGAFCVTLAVTKRPCWCPFCASLPAHHGSLTPPEPPGTRDPQDSNKTAPKTPSEQPVCCPGDPAHKVTIQCLINDTAVIKAEFSHEKRSHTWKSLSKLSSRIKCTLD